MGRLSTIKVQLELEGGGLYNTTCHFAVKNLRSYNRKLGRYMYKGKGFFYIQLTVRVILGQALSICHLWECLQWLT